MCPGRVGVTAGKNMQYDHEGGTPGTNASSEVFPESAYVVVVMPNTGPGSHDVAQHLIGLVLARG